MTGLDEYLGLIDTERASRPAEAMLADEVRRLREAIGWASRIFVALGHDMGTFDPAIPKDDIEKDILVWLGAFAPSPSAAQGTENNRG